MRRLRLWLARKIAPKGYEVWLVKRGSHSKAVRWHDDPDWAWTTRVPFDLRGFYDEYLTYDDE